MAVPTTIRITPVTLTDLIIIVESTNGIEVKTLADCSITASAITLLLATGSYNLRFYSQGYNVGILENASGLIGNQIELTPTSDYIKTSDGTNNYYVKDNYSRQFGNDLLDIIMTKADSSTIPTAISDLTDDTGTTPVDKAKSVKDQRDSSSLKYWTGTKAQYDAIATKDSNTIYNVEDATSPIISILDSLYPVGAIYIGTMSACPLQTLGIGTWQLVAQDRVLQGAGSRGAVGTTINESLPAMNIVNTGVLTADYGLTKTSGYKDRVMVTSTAGQAHYEQPSTYQDNAPVQQDGYLVNIWERTA